MILNYLFSFSSSIGDLSTSANEQPDWTTRLHIALNASQGNDSRKHYNSCLLKYILAIQGWKLFSFIEKQITTPLIFEF